MRLPFQAKHKIKRSSFALCSFARCRCGWRYNNFDYRKVTFWADKHIEFTARWP